MKEALTVFADSVPLTLIILLGILVNRSYIRQLDERILAMTMRGDPAMQSCMPVSRG